jgi:membrane peptidoglycan carboxypeptidase
LSGPYWQDQNSAGYDAGWRTGRDVPQRGQSAWDDDGGFWRGDRSSSRAERDGRQHRHQASQYRDSQPPSRGSRRAAAASGAAAGGSDAPWRNVLAGRSRRESQFDEDWGSGRSASRARRSADSDRGDWTGRLSQTADDLRNKLGLRSAGRAGSSARGSRSSLGDRGLGRGAGRAARGGDYYGPGDYGDGDNDSRLTGRRTAVRGPAGDFWDEPDRTSRGLRSRIAERQFTHGGGSGRGRGGNGRGGWGGGNGGGGGFKNWLLYGRWWRHWTWKKALAVVGGGIAACFLLGIATFFILYEMTPIPTAKQLTANWQSSSVYFANGKQMGTFNGTQGGLTIDRMLLTSAQIPPVMTEAMTAAEDRHFYTEGGVSVTGLMRAAYQDIFGNGNLQGGSTITMQYAKNYYTGVNSGQNLSTKLKEIFIAMKLGHAKSKQWVMTNYLNTVPFGATIDGLGAAAESYFNINLTQRGATLSLAQAALLAAMPNDPAVFSSALLSGDPKSYGYQLLQHRFSYVLSGLVTQGKISAAQAAATKFPKLNPPPAGNGETGVTGYLMNMVEQQLEAPYADGGYNLSQHAIDTGGYKIRTTFSMAKVLALARSVKAEKAQMKLAAAQGGGVSFRNYDRIGAVLENSKTGAIVAIYGGPGYLTNTKRCLAANCYINMAESAQQVGSSFKPYVLSAAVKAGMSVFTSKLNGYSPIWIPLSSVGTTPKELALSPTSQPPGPNCSAQTQNKVCYSSNGASYFLFNESSENTGPLKVNVAAAISSDPAFEDLAHRDGIQSVIDMAKLFGVGQNAFVEPCGASTNASSSTDPMAATITACNDLTGPGFKVGNSWYPGHGLENNFSPDSKDPGGIAAGTRGSPAIALGENPLTPIEQASTFATLADGGVYHTPTVIRSVQQNGTTLASHLTSQRVLSQPAAADIEYALSFDNNYPQGTAEVNVPFRRGDVIAKTGTLGTGANASQAWFIGATPDQYAMSVALFTNDPGKQNLDNLPSVGGTPGSQGGGWPASVWNNFMQAEFSNAPTVLLPQQVPGGFVPWIQVHAKKAKPKKQICQQGGGNQGGGGKKWCGNPNPNPSCNGNGNGNGNGNNCSASPSPTSSCPGFPVLGGQCGSPSPSVTPSGSPSPTPSTTCTTAPPGKCHAAHTASYVRSSAGAGSSPGSAASFVLLAAENAATRLAALLGLVV